MYSLSRCQPLCGTFFEIEIHSLKLNDDQLLETSQKAFQTAAFHEKTFSPFDSGSEVSFFNKLAISETYKASDLFYAALQKTKFLFDETNGLFNPHKETQGLGFDLLSNNIIKKTSRHEININGFIKGWIVDILTEALKKSGCDRVLVNGGGDLKYWMNPQISVQVDPPVVTVRDYADPKKIKSYLLKESCALATSAKYAYDFEHPKGYQIRKIEKDTEADFFFTATVIAPECWLADALTKVLVQNHKQAELCAKKWHAKFYFNSQEKELCFEPSKI